MSKLTSRRDFLKIAGLASAGFASSGMVITGYTPAAARKGVSAQSTRGFIESPMLAERVAAGSLPPIDERMPDEAFLVGPGVLLQEEYMDWVDGRFGGTLSIVALFPEGPLHLGNAQTILRSPGQTTAQSLPNVVEAFSMSDDYTTFQFTIRKGLKWSDGVPVTTEDVRFTFEDLYMEPTANRPWPVQLFTQSNSNLGPAELTVIDEFSFELKFSAPYGYFIAELNSWIPAYDIIFKPAHYLKLFHEKYASPEDLAAQLEANNETNWAQLLSIKDVSHWVCGSFAALGMPVLHPWKLVEAQEERRVFERNPYFWHVDSLGQQLPYIDRVVVDLVIDNDALINATVAGQQHLAAETEAPLNKLSQ